MKPLSGESVKDFLHGLLGRGARTIQQMALIDLGLRKLPVHVPCRGFISEPVTGTSRHPYHALFYGRQQHRIVHVVDCRRISEFPQEPRADDAVIYRDVPAGDVAAGGGGRRAYTIWFWASASGSHGSIAP
jgi:hypothetical protein